MRYIDADLIKYVPLKIRVNSRCIESSDFLTTKKDIDAIPTADVEEVRHGEWVRTDKSDYYNWECPLCGDMVEFRSVYCPNCGAKMDGGAK